MQHRSPNPQPLDNNFLSFLDELEKTQLQPTQALNSQPHETDNLTLLAELNRAQLELTEAIHFSTASNRDKAARYPHPADIGPQHHPRLLPTGVMPPGSHLDVSTGPALGEGRDGNQDTETKEVELPLVPQDKMMLDDREQAEFIAEVARFRSQQYSHEAGHPPLPAERGQPQHPDRRLPVVMLPSTRPAASTSSADGVGSGGIQGHDCKIEWVQLTVSQRAIDVFRLTDSSQKRWLVKCQVDAVLESLAYSSNIDQFLEEIPGSKRPPTDSERQKLRAAVASSLRLPASSVDLAGSKTDIDLFAAAALKPALKKWLQESKGMGGRDLALRSATRNALTIAAEYDLAAPIEMKEWSVRLIRTQL